MFHSTVQVLSMTRMIMIADERHRRSYYIMLYYHGRRSMLRLSLTSD